MWRMARLPFARKGQTSLVSDMDGKMSSWLITSLATFSSYSFGLLIFFFFSLLGAYDFFHLESRVAFSPGRISSARESYWHLFYSQ